MKKKLNENVHTKILKRISFLRNSFKLEFVRNFQNTYLMKAERFSSSQ